MEWTTFAVTVLTCLPASVCCHFQYSTRGLPAKAEHGTGCQQLFFFHFFFFALNDKSLRLHDLWELDAVQRLMHASKRSPPEDENI